MNGIDKTFMNKSKFTALVIDAVRTKKLSYIDASLFVCESVGIEPEDINKFISPSIKEKLEAEAMALNVIPRNNTLTFE